MLRCFAPVPSNWDFGFWLYFRRDGVHHEDAVVFLTFEGTEVRRVGVERPIGVVVHPKDGRVFVSSDTHCIKVWELHKYIRVQVFSSEADSLHTIGKRGQGECEFSTPCGMCITPYDQLLVVDRSQSYPICYNLSEMLQFFKMGVFRPKSVQKWLIWAKTCPNRENCRILGAFGGFRLGRPRESHRNAAIRSPKRAPGHIKLGHSRRKPVQPVTAA